MEYTDKNIFKDKTLNIKNQISRPLMSWKVIDGFKSYEVSCEGEVRNTKTGKLLLGSIKAGYVSINILDDNRKPKSFFIHRLVAFAFCPQKDGLTVVNHKNGNKKDNRAENLEWCTPQFNTEEAARLNLTKSKMRAVRRIDRNGEIVEFPSAIEAVKATETVNSTTAIFSVCKGETKTSGGYRWEYVEPTKVEIDPEDGVIIPGYENYKVTKDGQIYNIQRKRYLVPILNAYGYPVVNLSPEQPASEYEARNPRKKFSIHRLVALCFIPNPNPEVLTTVNHKNKIRTDNNVENLEWLSPADNTRHSKGLPLSKDENNDNDNTTETP